MAAQLQKINSLFYNSMCKMLNIKRFYYMLFVNRFHSSVASKGAKQVGKATDNTTDEPSSLSDSILSAAPATPSAADRNESSREHSHSSQSVRTVHIVEGTAFKHWRRIACNNSLRSTSDWSFIS